MKVKKSTAYALHALMYMVRHITQLPVTTNTIAKGEGIPPGYLAKIFQKLTKAQIIKGFKGRRKGYTFTLDLIGLFFITKPKSTLPAGIQRMFCYAFIHLSFVAACPVSVRRLSVKS